MFELLAEEEFQKELTPKAAAAAREFAEVYAKYKERVRRTRRPRLGRSPSS